MTVAAILFEVHGSRCVYMRHTCMRLAYCIRVSGSKEQSRQRVLRCLIGGSSGQSIRKYSVKHSICSFEILALEVGWTDGVESHID